MFPEQEPTKAPSVQITSLLSSPRLTDVWHHRDDHVTMFGARPTLFLCSVICSNYSDFLCVTTSVQTGSDLANECHRHYEDGHIKLFSILRRERETINESKDYCWLTYDLELYVGNWNFIMSFSNNILMYLFISCIFWFSLNEYVYIMEPFLYIEAFCLWTWLHDLLISLCFFHF